MRSAKRMGWLLSSMLLPLMLVASMLASAAPALADPVPVGAVKTLQGEVILTRGGLPQAVQVGSPVFEGDRLETRANAHVGITLRDSTRISLGPVTRIDLSHIVFVPEEKKYGLVLRLLSGTLDYLSGLTAKLAPESISIETPTSTIAVRGTHLLVRAEG